MFCEDIRIFLENHADIYSLGSFSWFPNLFENIIDSYITEIKTRSTIYSY